MDHMVFGLEVCAGLFLGIGVVCGVLVLAFRPEYRHPRKEPWMAPPSGDVDDYKFGGMGPND